MPTSYQYTARVHTARGSIPDKTANIEQDTSKILSDLYNLINFIKDDQFLNSLIGEIQVSADKEITLIPRIGKQEIILGEVEKLDYRFRNLKAFYRKVLPEKAWYYYKSINLKFEDQIVATTKICTIVGRQNEHGKIDILGLGKTHSDGVSRGVVTNIDKTVNAIREAINQASTKSDVVIKVANIGIAGQHIKSLQHRGIIVRNNPDEEINQNDINRLVNDMYKLVMQPGEEIIHVIPQEFIVDSEHGIKDPIGMAGVRLEGNFHIITGQVTAAKNLYRCVQKSGRQV
ncbi:MAG: hypothetical protein BRD49_04130, partial [Bacteroidetes bacterium SW_10_40_5]